MFGAGGGGGMGGHPGQHYDRFIYAAMLSRAKIEQAWSGGAEDPEAQTNKEDIKEPEPMAFDPAMLANLAQKAANGQIAEAPPALPSTKGFSPEVLANLAAAKSFLRPVVAAPVRATSSANDADSAEPAVNSVPLAFRPKAAKPQGEVSAAAASAVPLAFLKMRQAAAPSATAPSAGPPQVSAWSTDGAGSEPYDPSKPPDAAKATGDMENFKKEFQEKMEQSQKLLREAEQGASGPPALEAGQQGMSGGSEPYRPEDDVEKDNFRKAEASEAVQNIVSLKLAQAQKAVESTKAFHAVAPDPKALDQSREARRRSKWDGDAERAPMRVDTSDPAFADKSNAASGGNSTGDSISASYPVPSLRELSALARADANPDAPALGELRAPGNASGSMTDENKKHKTGAAMSRDQRARAKGDYRSRSRSRRRRARSPSSSEERKGKRLFTAKPSFRLTGSSFSSASTTKPEVKPQDAQLAELKKEENLPDWLKDLANPAPAPAPIQMGKKYLHMPRIMVEVLSHNGGGAMRACIEKSGAQIRVETMIEEPIGIVSVNGNVTLGETCIREALANKGLDLPPQDGLVMPFAPEKPPSENMQDIQIPSELVRHFVGHRGCNLKAITQKLGHAVSIQILPAILPGGFQRIQITGSNRAAARQMVMQHIDELKRQNLTLWGNDRAANASQAPVPPPPGPPPGGVRI